MGATPSALPGVDLAFALMEAVALPQAHVVQLPPLVAQVENSGRTCDAGVSVARGRGTATSPAPADDADGGLAVPGCAAKGAAGRKVARGRAACAASASVGQSPSITAGAATRSRTQGAAGRTISRHNPCINDVM